MIQLYRNSRLEDDCNNYGLINALTLKDFFKLNDCVIEAYNRVQFSQ